MSSDTKNKVVVRISSIQQFYIDTGELGYDGPLYDGFLHMTDDMLGPSPMHMYMTDQSSWSH